MSGNASEELPLNQPDIGTVKRVSTIRRRISVVLLIVAVTTLTLEWRSRLEPLWTGLQFAEMSGDGAFRGATLNEVQQHLSLLPAVVVENDFADETIYCCSWYSPLQHFRTSPQSELFLVASKDNPPLAKVYYNDRETPEEHARKLLRACRISEILTGSGSGRRGPGASEGPGRENQPASQGNAGTP